MDTDLDPIIDNWYMHLDKGQKFRVVDIDEDNEIVEVQHFDGDLEEVSFNEWRDMEIEISDEPQNWSGAIDVSELDDYGTEITDTVEEDWNEALED
ncbi:MAG: DUF6763 family protein [Gammaproteobacteria bacterium]|nr:DUF6763 family protein [Gammaproteobacteria bacterium]